LTRVRWYNAAPSALAPFAVVVLPFMVAWWRTRTGLHFQWIDVALAFAVAPQFLACWPSTVDWKISLRSWPYLLIAAGCGGRPASPLKRSVVHGAAVQGLDRRLDHDLAAHFLRVFDLQRQRHFVAVLQRLLQVPAASGDSRPG
jgi:hypothetical protein